MEHFILWILFKRLYLERMRSKYVLNYFFINKSLLLGSSWEILQSMTLAKDCILTGVIGIGNKLVVWAIQSFTDISHSLSFCGNVNSLPSPAAKKLVTNLTQKSIWRKKIYSNVKFFVTIKKIYNNSAVFSILKISQSTSINWW